MRWPFSENALASPVGERLHRGDVGARSKSLVAGARHDGDAHGAVGDERLPGIVEGVEQGRVEGVQLVGAVEGEGDDGGRSGGPGHEEDAHAQSRTLPMTPLSSLQ